MNAEVKPEKFTLIEGLTTFTGILVAYSILFLLTDAASRLIFAFIILVVLFILILLAIGFIIVGLLNFTLSTFSKIKERIKTPPASSLLKLSKLLPAKYCQILEQEISDMRLDYYKALREKNIWQARCITVFYYIGLSWSVVMWIADKVKKVIGIIPKAG